jgi:hypothetical protein
MSATSISCGYGTHWEGIGLAEGAGRVVAGVLGFFEEAVQGPKFEFRVVSPKVY